MDEKVVIKEDYIRLDAFLKLCGAMSTGGMAKLVIQDGHAEVNGEVCLQRGRKIRPGDTVTFHGESYVCDKAEL